MAHCASRLAPETLVSSQIRLHNPAADDVCAVGAPLSGAISDRLVIKYRKQRGRWVPEDRLRATIPGALVMVPVSMVLCGLTTHFVEGHLGLGLNCIWLFMNGLGVRSSPNQTTPVLNNVPQVDFVLCPSFAYNVDILHDRSAEVTAANS